MSRQTTNLEQSMGDSDSHGFMQKAAKSMASKPGTIATYLLTAAGAFYIANTFQYTPKQGVKFGNVNSAIAEDASDLKQAENYLINGDKLRKNKEYSNAIEELTKAKEIYSLEPDKVKRDGNYGAALISLADCYIHWTLSSKFIDKKTLPDSIENLKKGFELAERGVKDMEEYSQLGQEEKKVSEGFISWAYNLMGMATKYLGNPEKAMDYYTNSLKYDPNNSDAETNFRGVYNNYTVFIK
jgi:tetratricopeptide (TPR) repeat protein